MSSSSSETTQRVVLYVDDEPENLDLFRLQFDDHFQIHTARNADEALQRLEAEDIGVLLSDERMPGLRGVDLLARVAERWPDVVRVIVSAYADAERLLLAMNRGHAHEYVVKPWDDGELRACIERALAMAERRRRLSREADHGAGLAAMLAAERRRHRDPGRLIGHSTVLRATLDLARRAAASDATVILSGETGTGKELLAGFIHEASERAGGPFVAVNCAALPEGILESELFGHEQGAFTGAGRTRRGRFELAHRGTLFLDEIGDISPKLQVALLRVLQERTIERLGGSKIVPVDVRVIAATHRSLPELVREGRFRQDLYYRLNVIPIALPALRERPDDIEPLCAHFIEKHSRGRGHPQLGVEVREALRRYDWPGNVRELENVIQRALALRLGDELTLDDFCLELRPREPLTPRQEAREREAHELRDLLLRHGGNLARTARTLGVPRTTLAARAAKLGLV